MLYARLYTALELWTVYRTRRWDAAESLRRVLESVVRSSAALAGFQSLSARGYCYSCQLKSVTRHRFGRVSD